MRFGNVIQGEQAEAAGQAVMLGTDGKIPAEMLPETGGGQTVTKFTSMADMCDALSDAPSGTTFAFNGFSSDGEMNSVQAFGMIAGYPGSATAVSGLAFSNMQRIYLPFALYLNVGEVAVYSVDDMDSIRIPMDDINGVLVQPTGGGGGTEGGDDEPNTGGPIILPEL